jgi:hypothetical protein
MRTEFGYGSFSTEAASFASHLMSALSGGFN